MYCAKPPQSCLTLCDPMDCSPRLFCPWDSPGKNTGMGCHFLLQRIFATQGSNPGLLYCRQILYHLSYQGSPDVYPEDSPKEARKKGRELEESSDTLKGVR